MNRRARLRAIRAVIAVFSGPFIQGGRDRWDINLVLDVFNNGEHLQQRGTLLAS